MNRTDWLFRGSEVVFELYKAGKDNFIRVLWGGQPMKTSTPLGTLDMVPLATFFDCKCSPLYVYDSR